MLETQVGVVCRVCRNNLLPFLLHISNFAFEPLNLFGRILQPASRRFVVIQVCIWRPDILVSSGHDFQAKINVIESNLQLDFIEPADFFENGLANDQACGGDRRPMSST